MDNNPINMIRFGDKLRLSKLSLKNMPMITSIDAFTFTNVGGYFYILSNFISLFDFYWEGTLMKILKGKIIQAMLTSNLKTSAFLSNVFNLGLLVL